MSKLRKHLRRYNDAITTNWTFAITLLLLLVFKIEQVLVYLTDASSPKGLLESVGVPENIIVFLLSPILHSDGGHIASNLFWLVLLGGILEQRVELREYFGFLFGVAIFSNFVAPFAGQIFGLSVGFAIGISGTTHALGMRESIYRAYILSDRDQSTNSDWMIFLIAFASTILLTLIILRGQTDPGNSAVAHATGLFLGGVFGVAELNGFNRVYGWMQIQYSTIRDYLSLI